MTRLDCSVVNCAYNKEDPAVRIISMWEERMRK